MRSAIRPAPVRRRIAAQTLALALVAYDRLRFRVVVPFLVSDGPSSIRLRGTSSIDSKRESGLGDIAASGSLLFEPFAAGLPYLELGAQVTAATRSSVQLGTGEWAVAARIDLFEKLGPVTPFASFGRSFYTSRQQDSLDDRFFSSLGASLELAASVAMGLSYD